MSPHHRPPTIVIVTFGLAGVLLAPAPVRAQGTPPPETIEYYATDALGSVRVVFTPTGQVIGRSDYLPFGETFTQSGALPHQRFTGQARDGEAGLDDFNARSLQARTGRFNRPDPVFAGAVANPQAWNRYRYAANSPLVLTDPTGLIDVFRTEVVGHMPRDPSVEAWKVVNGVDSEVGRAGGQKIRGGENGGGRGHEAPSIPDRIDPGDPGNPGDPPDSCTNAASS